MKPGETELLRLRNQTNAISALAELVWNSIDADAKSIHVDWDENEMMGVETISVSDDGHGIEVGDDEDKFSDHPFASLGDSAKHTVSHQSPAGRILHGRFGKGRIRALALGGVIDWETVYKNGSKSNKRYSIRAVVGGSESSYDRRPRILRSPPELK